MTTVDQYAADQEESERIQLGPQELVEDPAPSGINLSFLKAQTGPGDISEYVNHPLNFAKSEGLGQVIRGLTGMLGELRYAIVDIVMGAMRFSNERKKQIVEVPHE